MAVIADPETPDAITIGAQLKDADGAADKNDD